MSEFKEIHTSPILFFSADIMSQGWPEKELWDTYMLRMGKSINAEILSQANWSIIKNGRGIYRIRIVLEKEIKDAD